MTNKYIALTQQQEEILTGLMLGDGHLCLNGISAYLTVVRAIKDKEYLEYEADIFFKFLTKSHQEIGLKQRSHYKKEYNKTYIDVFFNTSNNPVFLAHQEKWYRNCVKIVPSDLKLTSTTVAHWIADDAYLTTNKLPYRFAMSLSTHGFTKDEVYFLADLLHERYQEKFIVSPSKKKYYFIRGYDSACRAIFADIDPYFKMKRKRIWEEPDARFYANQPERQVSQIETIAARRKYLAEVIDLGNSITMKELAVGLGYIYNGKIDYRNVNYLLQPYLNSGKVSKEVDKFNNNTTTIKVIK
jgi:LAGLIDADG DNA endonuclease family protein